MIYIKDIAKEVRAELKKKFPDCKFSVTIERFTGGRALDVALMSAPFDPYARMTDTAGNEITERYSQLNHIHIRQDHNDNWISNGVFLTEQAAKMLKEVNQIANRRNWDNSDIQTDYFDVNYYFHLAIGKWDKEFEIK